MFNVTTDQEIKLFRGSGPRSIKFSDEREQLLTGKPTPIEGASGDGMCGEMTNVFLAAFRCPHALWAKIVRLLMVHEMAHRPDCVPTEHSQELTKYYRQEVLH